MKKLKIFKAVFCLLLVVLLTACSGGEKKSSAKKKTNTGTKDSISLLYCRSDGFNPYTALSAENRRLCLLIYEPLVKTDNNFKPVKRLANTVSINGLECTVQIKDVKFSDGSTVTADDVVYSYKLAKSSTTNYAAKLYEVVNASALNSNTVVFRLSQNDPYFENLIDFPILKAGTESRSDSDGMTIPPVGCGRYTVSESKTSLVLNESFYESKGNIKKINLIDVPDEDAISHYVEVGAAGIYYTDLSDGNIVRMSGKKADVHLNNLVYIGINSSYGDLANLYMRYAISSALNRKEICQNAYYNGATPATGFFSPYFEDVKAVQTLNTENDNELTVENLGKIGYNKINALGFYTNGTGAVASYTLLVNAENRSRVIAANLIANQLKNAGINIAVTEKPYAEYIALLQSGNFQLYLGEVNILPNMDLAPLTTVGGSTAYGVGLEPVTVDETGATLPTPAQIIKSAFDLYKTGKGSVSDIASALMAQMPQIPICYRLGYLFYSDDISTDVVASESDIYFSIESY